MKQALSGEMEGKLCIVMHVCIWLFVGLYICRCIYIYKYQPYVHNLESTQKILWTRLENGNSRQWWRNRLQIWRLNSLDHSMTCIFNSCKEMVVEFILTQLFNLSTWSGIGCVYKNSSMLLMIGTSILTKVIQLLQFRLTNRKHLTRSLTQSWFMYYVTWVYLIHSLNGFIATCLVTSIE